MKYQHDSLCDILLLEEPDQDSRCSEKRGTADATSPPPSRSARDPAPPGAHLDPPSSSRAEEASLETAGGHDGGACLC